MAKAGNARKSYSTSRTDYKLLEEVGHGASATVYRAIYLPSDEIVAVKCLDFDRCNGNLDDIRKESLTLSMLDHPNVISAYCSFVVEHYLWVVMPFMAEGSCLHLMKIAHPDGFEEAVIGSILKETLKALEYLHRDGHIHRDVKAGNILVDSFGAVRLGDFGVSAWMFDGGDRRISRHTFVGTPCWMAPEILQPGGSYNSKADIWSFGITALELAHGHAPFSKYPPMKVLLMTLQNAPPGLDYERDKRFSKSFKEMIAMCLVKDQTKRPTAEKLLKHSFFKRSKPPELTMKSIFKDLPPLWDRVKAIEYKDAAQLALRRMPSLEEEALSQSEYQRGVSAWNFDIEDLKAQASAIHDDEDLPETKEGEESMKIVVTDKDLSSSTYTPGKSAVSVENSLRMNNSITEEEAGCLMTKDETAGRVLVHSNNQERKDGSKTQKLQNDLDPSVSKQDRESSHLKAMFGKKQTCSGPLKSNGGQNNLMMEQGFTTERVEGDNQQAAEKYKHDTRKVANFSGPLMLPTRASGNSLSAPTQSSGGYGDPMEDKAKHNVVQIKGRFSVTSENVDLVKDIPLCTISQKPSQESPMKKSASAGDRLIQSKPMPSSESPKERHSAIPASLVLPHLQNIFHLTSLQQDLIMNVLNGLEQNEGVYGGVVSQSSALENDVLVESITSERERLLLIEISESQARMNSLIDELTAEKLRHIQLQQEFNALHSREDVRTEAEDT